MSLVDGFELKFVSRTQSAERRHNGRLVDTVPVAWVSSWRNGEAPVASEAAPKNAKKSAPREAFLEIAFHDADEMAAQKAKAEPFVVALAQAKAKGDKSRAAATEFRGVFEVAPTGVELSPLSLETRILRRVVAGAA